MAVIEAIATQYLEADAASVTFSGIPATYQDLQLRMMIQGRRTDSTNTTEIRLNGDTASNYSGHAMYGTGSNQYGFGVAAHGYLGYSSVLYTPSGTKPRESYAVGIVDIADYANTNKNKTVMINWGIDLVGYGFVGFVSGCWDSTAAVTSVSITINPTYDTGRGSSFTLYGLNSS